MHYNNVAWAWIPPGTASTHTDTRAWTYLYFYLSVFMCYILSLKSRGLPKIVHHVSISFCPERAHNFILTWHKPVSLNLLPVQVWRRRNWRVWVEWGINLGNIGRLHRGKGNVTSVDNWETIMPRASSTTESCACGMCNSIHWLQQELGIHPEANME